MVLNVRRQMIMQYLLDYRGMNVKQMTTFVYQNTYYTTSNLKQVQRELKELKNKNLVNVSLYSEPIIDMEGTCKTQQVSMYYLSAKGYEYMLQLNDVVGGQQGRGYLFADEFVYGDISYEVHKPPLILTPHHIMAVNAFIQICCKGRMYPHRNNLYASRKYEGGKLRPDAEVLINGKVYYLEFDRYSEKHGKLVEKFKNYAAYFDTLSPEDLSKNGKIIFVIEDVKKSIGINRRWNDILAAFFKGLGKYFYNINLVLCSESELYDILDLEYDQVNFMEDHGKFLYTRYKSLIWKNNNGVFGGEQKNGSANGLYFSSFTHAYDSSIIQNFAHCLNFAKKENLKFLNQSVIPSIAGNLDWNLNLKYYGVNASIVNVWEKFIASDIEQIPCYKITNRLYDATGIFEDVDVDDYYL